ncbi:hypothetical protein Sste5344_008169 [Sporothrix stenoceras]
MSKPSADPPSYTAPPSDGADLPSYAEAVTGATISSTFGNDIVQPTILVLDGQAIYAETDPSTHLYEVNRGLASLGEATLAVEFTRFEQRAGHSTNRRERHIYNLRRKPPPMHLRRVTGVRNHEKGQHNKNTPDYFIQSVAAPSRRLGHLGYQTTNSIRGGQWSATVLPVDMKGWAERDCPPFVDGTAPVFTARQRQGACKWMLGDGADVDSAQDVAMEYDSELAVHRLLVTAPLTRENLDALT